MIPVLVQSFGGKKQLAEVGAADEALHQFVRRVEGEIAKDDAEEDHTKGEDVAGVAKLLEGVEGFGRAVGERVPW